MRTSSFPSLRRPVSAARTLCTCHPVAAVKSPIAAPSGRCSRLRIVAFFDGRAGVAGERTFAARDDAALVARRCGVAGLADLRALFRAGCPAAFGLLALRCDLGMIEPPLFRRFGGAVTATSPAGDTG